MRNHAVAGTGFALHCGIVGGTLPPAAFPAPGAGHPIQGFLMNKLMSRRTAGALALALLATGAASAAPAGEAGQP